MLRRRVLVVDDEPLFARAVARAMRKDADVVLEETATAALERIRLGENFDLILCDVALPGLSGPDFFERLVDAVPELESRVVFVTGGAVGHMEVRLARTRRPCLNKPITGAVLVALLDRRNGLA